MGEKRTDGIDVAIHWFNGETIFLAEYSRLLMKRYWDEWNAQQSDSARFTPLGRLGVRVMYQEKTHTLSICWYRRKIVDTPTGRKVTQIYIKKASGEDRYNDSKIRRVARPWEYQLFLKYEKEFELIRKKSRHFGKVRRHLRTVLRVLNNDPVTPPLQVDYGHTKICASAVS